MFYVFLDQYFSKIVLIMYCIFDKALDSSPLLDIWNKLFFSNFLNTLPLISTNYVWEKRKKKDRNVVSTFMTKNKNRRQIITVMLQVQHFITNIPALMFLDTPSCKYLFFCLYKCFIAIQKKHFRCTLLCFILQHSMCVWVCVY